MTLNLNLGRAALLIMLALSRSAGVRADDWPQWRGPNRDGVCAETNLMQSFPAGWLKVRWRAAAGWGFSSPVVAQGRVMLADSVVVKPTANERVRCFDEVTGKELWSHTHEVAYDDWTFDPTQQIGPVATPIVHKGKVYTVGRTGHLFCFDVRSGNIVWQKRLDKEYGVAFAAGAPSPLIEGDSLILFAGAKPSPTLIALNTETGKEIWKALDESLTFSSPIVVSAGGSRQLIVWTQESVTSLDPATGKTWWRQRLRTSSDYTVSTPVSQHGRLLIGGMMFELAADKPNADVIWPDSKVPARRIYSHTSTALIIGAHVYSAKSSGELICVDAKTGKQLWETNKVTDLKNGASVHLTRNGDTVLMYTDRGQLIRAALTAQGYRELGRVAVIEPTFPFGGRNVNWSPPAYANGHIVVRNSKEILSASLAAER
jgi:outer membrane protein assembly factor BamB